LAEVATINVTIRPTFTRFDISGEVWDKIRYGHSDQEEQIPEGIVTVNPDNGRLVIWLASSPLEVVDEGEE
jgi:hypothetical protein